MREFLVAMMGATVVLTSCTKKQIEPKEEHPDGAKVSVSFDFSTTARAFFDASDIPEPWEKAVNKLCLLVYNPKGQLVSHREITKEEIEAGSVFMIVPSNNIGKQCTFYAVANFDVDPAELGLEKTLLELFDDRFIFYNGPFAEVTTKSVRSDGFSMTASEIKTLAKVTSVNLVLKRTVAKIAIRTTVSPEFSENYNGGKLVIERTRFTNMNLSSPLIYRDINITQSFGYEFEQQPKYSDGSYLNLVYIPERPKNTMNPHVVLHGFYDQDGDLSTEHDRIAVRYSIPINSEPNFGIKRNGYYRIDATIKGFEGAEATAKISVSNWEIESIQNEHLR